MRGSLSYRGSVSSRSGTQEPEAYDTIVPRQLGGLFVSSLGECYAPRILFFGEGRRFCSPPPVLPSMPGASGSGHKYSALECRYTPPCFAIHSMYHYPPRSIRIIYLARPGAYSQIAHWFLLARSRIICRRCNEGATSTFQRAAGIQNGLPMRIVVRGMTPSRLLQCISNWTHVLPSIS